MRLVAVVLLLNQARYQIRIESESRIGCDSVLPAAVPIADAPHFLCSARDSQSGWLAGEVATAQEP
jgi:hypothetical protein